MTKTPTLFLKPVDGRRVRREDGPLLSAEGETVSASPYWSRKLDDGDVIATTPPKTPKPTAGAD
ncbi:DUF2635 domain-containing protein [Brevundimonas vitis]|uniref:DUF2635 domain-containing protein n=1 Tax=Brevundimonas vitisensis TaxID=2800818 RepID=A0ABX7BQ06_9CAUL|nr:DUF2635 domain-containing protein [Brevundimonas vitisensis]QQQ19672.1 DUF2635 domain-containing protein [Brevundimonas vitisensis]